MVRSTKNTVMLYVTRTLLVAFAAGAFGFYVLPPALITAYAIMSWIFLVLMTLVFTLVLLLSLVHKEEFKESIFLKFAEPDYKEQDLGMFFGTRLVFVLLFKLLSFAVFIALAMPALAVLSLIVGVVGLLIGRKMKSFYAEARLEYDKKTRL